MNKKQNLWVLGHKITPVEVSGNYDMVIGETAPNVPGPPPHFHSGLNEMFMVLEGEMEFVVDGELRRVGPGESVDLPPNVVHTFKNGGSSSCKWLNVHSPKGFYSFFKEMGVPEDVAESMKKSVDQAIIQKVMAKAADYDMHIQV